MKYYFILIVVIFNFPKIGNCQIHCGGVNLEIEGNNSVNFQFSNLREYSNGIIQYGVFKLKVKVDDLPIPDGFCRWYLEMFVDNNGGNPAKWEQSIQYGFGSGRLPNVNALQFRVRNGCNTSPLDNGVFHKFRNTIAIEEIIENVPLITPAGTCTENVNGPGTSLSNYQEFVFNIDLKVTPGVNFQAGMYNLNLRFKLQEGL